LTKLRGIRISKPSYIYTLNKGIFQSYNPYDPSEFTPTDSYNNNSVKRTKIQNRPTKPSPSLGRDHYITSGYDELDEALGGGFPRRGIVLLETESNIHSKVVLTLLAGILSNILRNDNPILIEPFMGIDAKTIMSYLRPYLPPEQKKDLVRICQSSDMSIDLPSCKSRYQDLGNPQKQIQCFCEMIAKARRDYQNKLLVNIMGMSMCSRIHQHKEENGTDLMPFITATSDLTLIPIERHHGNELNLTEMADVQLYLTRICGALVLHSAIPETVPYAVVTDKSSGYPVIRLESLV
jgi:hypothetical protein